MVIQKADEQIENIKSHGSRSQAVFPAQWDYNQRRMESKIAAKARLFQYYQNTCARIEKVQGKIA